MKFNYLFFIVFLSIYLRLVLSSTPTGCKYYNTLLKLNYDLTPLIKPNGGYYETHFPSYTRSWGLIDSYNATYNFCGTVVQKCQDSLLSGCQIYDNHPTVINTLSTTTSETQQYTNNGMVLIHKTTFGETGHCSTPNNQRILYQYLNCNPYVDFNVTKPGNESVPCLFEIRIDTKYVCQTKNCTGCSSLHGTCNIYTDVCQCDSQTTGKNCTTPIFSISSVQNTTVKGGTVTIKGSFSTVTNYIKVWIGSVQCTNVTFNSSFITCNTSPGTGLKNVTLTDGVNGELILSKLNMFQYINLTCPGCSTIHGICNGYTGICECDTQTMGTNCTESRLFISSVQSTTVKGGEVIINGYFGNTSSSLKVFIGLTQCIKIVSNSSSISCTISGGNGTYDVTITDRDLSVNSIGSFEYILLSCPLNCSIPHGSCNPYTGLCSCDEKTSGNGCEISLLRIDHVDSTTTKGGNTTIYGFFGNSNSIRVWIGDEECLNVTSTTNTIECDIGPGIGEKNITIQENDLRLSVVNIYKFNSLICPNNCTYPHGSCNEYTGLCICDTQTTSLECNVSKIYVSSCSSAPDTGGMVEIYGYFGIISNDFKLWIGEKQCNDIQQINITMISCIVEEGFGSQNITIRDRDLYYSSNNIFNYFITIKPLICPNNCTNDNQGYCEEMSGRCKCKDKYYGADCASLSIDFVSDNYIPLSFSNINYITSEAFIGNEVSNYSINLYSLIEVRIDGSIETEHPLYNITWNIDSNYNIDNKVKSTLFKYSLSNKASIEYLIEEIIETKEYSFANIDFKMDPNSIKTTISIKNYTYQSVLNTLQLRMVSSLKDSSNDNKNNNNCNSKDININTKNLNNDQPINYIIISKDSKIFYSEIINKQISDGHQTFMSSTIISNSSTSIIIGLNLAHCVKECIIDPSFQVLVDPNYQTDCSKITKSKWLLSVTIVSPIVGVGLIIALTSIIYTKFSISIKLKIHSIKTLLSIKK